MIDRSHGRIAASHPDTCPAQSCRAPVTDWTCFFATEGTALPKICLSISQTPISRTPGFLSSGTKQQSYRANVPRGSTNSLGTRRQRGKGIAEISWKPWTQCRHFYVAASSPEGPAEPLDLRSICLMRRPSYCFKNNWMDKWFWNVTSSMVLGWTSEGVFSKYVSNCLFSLNRKVIIKWQQSSIVFCCDESLSSHYVDSFHVASELLF